MSSVKIITDSCSDLSSDLLEKYGIDYGRMNSVYMEKETPADLSWSSEDVHRFYNIIRDGNRITTTQVPAEEFERVFTLYLEKGMDIVYISCSNKQSGSIGTAEVEAKKLSEKYPDRKIVCVDSLNASMGEGLLAIEAAKLAEEGLGAEEIGEKIISVRKNVNEFVTVHSLDALKRAGRVTASSAFFGNLLGVKPVLIADADGVQTAVKKVKGRNKSLEEIVSLMKEAITEPEKQTVYVTHSDCSEEEKNLLKELITSQINCKEIHFGPMGPIIGASIGPDAFGIFAFGKEVTYRVGE